MPAPGRKFDNWLKAYMAYSAESEAPDKFHYWTAVSCVAGALQRRVWLEMGYFQWLANFYIIFVAPPGIVSKSTTANIGMDLLRQVPGIKFGPDVVTWQALTQALAQSTEMFPMPDGTFMPQSAITIVSSELGNFFNPNDREMVDLLVALWDGQKGVFSKATKTQGSDSIENPWVNIVGCTTPSWIAGNFPDYLIGGGFTSRCIFVYSDYKRHLNAYPVRTLPPDFLQTRADLIEDLKVIATLTGEYKLSDQALLYGEQWYKHHYENRPAWLDNSRFAGYLARKQTHIHKLAMVIAAAQRNELIITEEDLDAAVKIIDSIEPDMPKVFASIGRSQASVAVFEVVQTLKAFKKLPLNQLYQHCVRTMSKKEFEEAFSSAVYAGFLRLITQGNEVFVEYVKDTPTT
jgi:hypothetical protein